MRLNKMIDAEVEKAAFSQALGPLSFEEKLQLSLKLPELGRARLAKFCYNRAHLRQLGLQIAVTCRLQTLQLVFGASAALVLEQASGAGGIDYDLAPAGRRFGKKFPN
jgi:hypothetical protein